MIDGQPFDPRVVAATLSERHSPSPLFVLEENEETITLSGAGHRIVLSRTEVESATPDPLGSAAYEICSHMEEDHRDTFVHFLRWRGRSCEDSGQVTMPWVDRSGFLLADGSELSWIPFDEDCTTPNLVRKNLIKMLRKIRDE